MHSQACGAVKAEAKVKAVSGETFEPTTRRGKGKERKENQDDKSFKEISIGCEKKGKVSNRK